MAESPELPDCTPQPGHDMKEIKVLIADDHTLFRSGLQILLRNVEDIRLVAEACDGEEAISLFTAHQPDVILLDISMPKLDGIEVTRLIKSLNAQARILILTMHEQEDYLFRIMGAGADGYLLKNAEKDELLESIRCVADGKQFFSAPVFKMMAERYIHDAQQLGRGTSRAPEPPPARNSLAVRLTNREHEILNLIALGNTNPEIATKLFISPRTVDTHRTNLMQKLGIKNTAGLVRFAIEQGLASDSHH
ncbi:response regulator transcription factor [Candidatus Cyanaurora vandensis]|uniref:response regulator transcription factor n=2 Tax=Candidatus Cyanaurora vandensis TaxID=2714958 RepID=UPI00257BEF5E|nr:response regulator transcription factor [Candidatus Cyanaurora vandensis]